MVDDAGHNYCSLIIGRARVAPLKAVSIPRFELTVEFCPFLRARDQRAGFTKLQLRVLDGLYTYPPMHAQQNQALYSFVANRLAIICERTSISSWKYVPSKLNPAGFATKVILAELSSHFHSWLQGPLFLWKTDDLWLAELPALPEVPTEFFVPKVKVPKLNGSFVITTSST